MRACVILAKSFIRHDRVILWSKSWCTQLPHSVMIMYLVVQVSKSQCQRSTQPWQNLHWHVWVPCRDVQIARTKERNCSSCHSAMSLAYSAVQFLEKSQQRQQQQQQTIIGSSLTSDARQREDRTQSQLIPGTALPAKGTCKHYPHSYRWLRFPCCGKRFPCDLCHEEESDGHHMKWAYRHVCGFCSTEQVIQLNIWLHACTLHLISEHIDRKVSDRIMLATPHAQ